MYLIPDTAILNGMLFVFVFFFCWERSMQLFHCTWGSCSLHFLTCRVTPLIPRSQYQPPLCTPVRESSPVHIQVVTNDLSSAAPPYCSANRVGKLQGQRVVTAQLLLKTEVAFSPDCAKIYAESPRAFLPAPITLRGSKSQVIQSRRSLSLRVCLAASLEAARNLSAA
jgi:hypothetical protein